MEFRLGRPIRPRPGLALAVDLLPCRRSLQTATILVLFGICDQTLRLRDKLSATHSGWNYYVGRFPRVVRSEPDGPPHNPGLISFTLSGFQFGFALIREIRVKIVSRVWRGSRFTSTGLTREIFLLHTDGNHE